MTISVTLIHDSAFSKCQCSMSGTKTRTMDHNKTSDYLVKSLGKLIHQHVFAVNHTIPTEGGLKA